MDCTAPRCPEPGIYRTGPDGLCSECCRRAALEVVIEGSIVAGEGSERFAALNPVYLILTDPHAGRAAIEAGWSSLERREQREAGERLRDRAMEQRLRLVVPERITTPIYEPGSVPRPEGA